MKNRKASSKKIACIAERLSKAVKRKSFEKNSKPKKEGDTLNYKQILAEYRQKSSTPPWRANRPSATQPALKPAAEIKQPERYSKLFDPKISGVVDYHKKGSVTKGELEKAKKYGHTLKKMIKCLKKVDPKTKLPGILLDKKSK